MITNPGQRAKELYEFGPFRVDPERETLLREGEPVALTPKTFQILLVLIRHNEEVVTKDELMRAVWPDTFVEEANLSRNIFMLRKALGETAQDHRYIVTVPGRGYRLAENVQVIPEQEVKIVAATHSIVHVDVKESRSWPWRWLAVGVVILLVVGLGMLWRFLAHRRTVLGSRDTVVLADFANSTGDPVFDETLREGLAIELEQSPFLSVVSDQRIRHMLALMGHAADARITPEIARGVCERTGSAAILGGSIAPLGSQYVLELRAKSCRTGEVLDQEQVQVAKKEDVLNALGQISRRFRERLGESLTTIQEHNTPLAEATTPSLEALEAFSMGWKLHTTSGTGLPFLQRAVETDPNFALAYSTLGRAYADVEEGDLSVVSSTRAWQLRDHASDREKFVIDANYAILATGNLEAARQTLEAWSQMYPRDAAPHVMLSGYPNKAAGRFEEAIAEGRKTIELDPDFAIAYFNIAVNNVYLNRLDEAGNVLRRAAGRGLEIDEFLMLDYDIAFLRGDRAGMEQVAARARQRSGGETWISNKEALALAYSGHLQRARLMSRRAVDYARQQAMPERAGAWEAAASMREAVFGNSAEALTRALAAFALSKDREVEYCAAYAMALSGETSQAQGMADDLARHFPENTVVRFSYLPVIRAQLALNHGDAAKAIEELQVAAPFEVGAARDFCGALHPVYVRGEAYLAAGKGAEAATEFQKILDHRGVVGSEPIGALAHLQMGRALALAGETDKAKQAYEDFLAEWAGADASIPVLKRAHAEYMKLVSK
ncbi:winged helix-turn-helix domain-containing protein [Tunturiibacter lichenicola]|uniref:winged helix-turn-helix domain-containing protein n=1 Tax=Tunturiibacter lichenicola TaxID=2051959 RepID=UPI003D9ACFA5